MATLNLVEQVVIFVSATSDIDEVDILNNSLVKSFIDNSVGKKCELSFKNYVDDSSGAYAFSSLFELRSLVLPGFVATIQANIPNLQAAFPTYFIATWGGNVVYGN